MSLEEILHNPQQAAFQIDYAARNIEATNRQCRLELQLARNREALQR